MAAPFRCGARGGKRGGGVKSGKPHRFRQGGVTGRKASPRNGGGFPQIDGGRMDHRPVKRAKKSARPCFNRFGGIDGGGNRKRQSRLCLDSRTGQAASAGNRAARPIAQAGRNARRIDEKAPRAV